MNVVPRRWVVGNQEGVELRPSSSIKLRFLGRRRGDGLVSGDVVCPTAEQQ